MTEQPETLDLVWGAASIAALIGKTTRATFGLLEAGELPGAKKVGGRWVISRRKLLALFEAEEAA
jgi:hypothetical protein